MSDIDDLEAIVESTHFGRSPNALFTGSRSKLQKSFETCKRGHDLNVTGRWHRNGKKGRRRVCTECHRILTGFKGIYKPRKHNGD